MRATRYLLRTLASALVILSLPLAALAGDQAPVHPKGSLVTEYTLSYGVSNDSDSVSAVRAGAGYFLFDDLSANLNVMGAYLDLENSDDAAAVGLEALLRWYAARMGKASVFLEAGIGVLEATEPVPSKHHGTHFNFTPQGGAGVEYALTEDLSLVAGFRYMHISNANSSGSDHNNGMETFNGYAGVQIPF